ncbi:MAG TPA: cation-translocating P-type ATPase [Rhizomicrobium sp.]|nr:cation-translocating P-type ATPase [Rhizomicrobium sp.]
MRNAEIEKGLSSAEAAARLRAFGANELPSPERRDFARIVLEILRQPMFALLLAGAAVYLLIGESADAVVLSLFGTLSVSIGILQETRSERVLQSLRNLASPRALVVRDGVRQRIAGRDVVPGDVMILSEGDRVPADAILMSGHDLMADESLLTGESVSVRKTIAQDEPQWGQPGGDDLPFVFAGTLVVRGTGIARVAATGLHSEMGKIGRALQSITLEQPRLRAQLSWLIRDFALAGAVVVGLAVLMFGLVRGSWLEAALGGIAIGMALLPEEIPLVVSVFMAMGAWRISRARVLTRRATAIEALGSATVLCTDKTGTLTENRMRIAFVAAGDEIRRSASSAPSERIAHVVKASLGASAPLPTDPMDRAILEQALAEPFAGRTLLKAFGLRPDLFVTTNVWSEPDGSLVAYAKGAPEAIAGLCRLPEAQRMALLRQVDGFAAQGIRVLAVAEAVLASSAALPESQREMPFVYLGLLGFADPLRAGVPAAVKECRDAGVRVIMITGDYPATARAIADQAGIGSGGVLSGEDLEAMSDAELAQKMETVSVFARVRPQQKLRLVEALKRDGEIVAMTGDGVNDAPAMKAAHIGIAMGGRGTDVAREAASLVLLSDDFASIVSTIRLGRRIYDNLGKAIQYIVAVHIPIAGLALLPLLFGLPLMLSPVHIAFLEMVIDPACSVVFESEVEEEDVMRRPPRKPDAPMFPRATAVWAAAQGLAALAIVTLALFLGTRLEMPQDDLRAFVFTVLVLMNIGLILVNRSFGSSLSDALLRPNLMLWVLVAAVLSVLATALYWRPAQVLFHFGPLHSDDLMACLAAGAGLIMLLEAGKRFGVGKR